MKKGRLFRRTGQKLSNKHEAENEKRVTLDNRMSGQHSRRYADEKGGRGFSRCRQ